MFKKLFITLSLLTSGLQYASNTPSKYPCASSSSDDFYAPPAEAPSLDTSPEDAKQNAREAQAANQALALAQNLYARARLESEAFRAREESAEQALASTKDLYARAELELEAFRAREDDAYIALASYYNLKQHEEIRRRCGAENDTPPSPLKNLVPHIDWKRWKPLERHPVTVPAITDENERNYYDAANKPKRPPFMLDSSAPRCQPLERHPVTVPATTDENEHNYYAPNRPKRSRFFMLDSTESLPKPLERHTVTVPATTSEN